MGLFSSIVGGVSAAVGVVGGIKSAKTADNLAKDQKKSAERQYEFAREQYDDWKSIYGPIEQNLAEFYQNLTPQYFAAQGLQAYEQEFQKNLQETNEFFEVADIETGVQADLRTKMGLQATRDKAAIKADAPFKVADEKNKFLSVGLGNKASAINATTYAGNSLSNVLGTQASIAGASADRGFNAASSGFGTLAEGIDESGWNPFVSYGSSTNVRTANT